MRIAIASGKGGTGKTTLATNLAVVAAELGRRVELLDCDVEAPNGHLFLRPDWEDTRTVTLRIPTIDAEKCNHCGLCSQICAFNALACLPDSVMVFPDLCHGCGGCFRICPAGAILPGAREVGVVQTGRVRGFRFTHGRLRVGEVQAPPLIDAVLATTGDDEGLVLIDAPPGTSCPVVAALKNSDFVLLVTEPTPFGLNDLRLAVDLVREMKLPFAVAVNRTGVGDDRILRFCADEDIPLVAAFPDDRRVAEAYARGEMAVDAVPELKDSFRRLLETLETRALQEAII